MTQKAGDDLFFFFLVFTSSFCKAETPLKISESATDLYGPF